MKPRTLVTLMVLVLLAGGGYYAFSRTVLDGAPLASQPSTSVVRQSSLQVRVSGSGEMVAAELPLAFAVPGVMTSLNVSAGDYVEAGQILASLDDRQAQLDLRSAQLNWDLLTAPQKVSEAEQDLVNQQLAVTEAREWLAFIEVGVPKDYYLTQYNQALAEYLDLKAKLTSARAANDRKLISQLENQLNRAEAVLEKAQSDLDWVENYQPDPQELALAQAQVSLAEARHAAQQTLVDVLHGAPLPAPDAYLDRNDALLALERANLALKKAQWALDQTNLTAPTAGIVTQVHAAPGERMDGSAVLVIREEMPVQVRFYLEESDLALVSSGDRLEIHLQAYPDQVFEGTIVRVDPALVPVSGTLLAQVWGVLSLQPGMTLYPGMSLEVDVIAAEANAALLIPLQALRQAADGTYFVDVQQADGTFRPTPVIVGLKDLANAQILNGLQVGDQVSTAAR